MANEIESAPQVECVPAYGKLVRSIRIERGLKQREAAALAGVAHSTYANLESSSLKVIKRAKFERLLDGLEVPILDRKSLLNAYDAAPVSTFVLKRREVWGNRNETRRRARMSTPLARALLRLVVREWEAASDARDDGDLERSRCVCEGDTECELCEAARALELNLRWPRAGEDLAPFGDALENLLAKHRLSNEPSIDGDLEDFG